MVGAEALSSSFTRGPIALSVRRWQDADLMISRGQCRARAGAASDPA